MTLAKKLDVKPGMRLRIVGKPVSVDLDDVETTNGRSDAVVVFVKRLEDVDKRAAPAIAVAQADGLSWIAYPTEGRLGTDLDRDTLCRHLEQHDLKGVQQVAIDDTWGAVRFRPAP